VLWSGGAGDGGGELVGDGGSTVHQAVRWGRGAPATMEGSSRRRRSARGRAARASARWRAVKNC
jgi:hypothetical protein